MYDIYHFYNILNIKYNIYFTIHMNIDYAQFITYCYKLYNDVTIYFHKFNKCNVCLIKLIIYYKIKIKYILTYPGKFILYV